MNLKTVNENVSFQSNKFIACKVKDGEEVEDLSLRSNY